ncbi:hypothetical protein COEREDRAFT_13013 [Coemansia reversa NRRL 1564]|uniref:Uncharacterized protein n=1 Tax=Coemansia reversa (strain ATCC 12441 / NRRL 1564) TaxID=763665 RepID=A0A2G5BL01_COERN|nr:hypothetical protein COEREDRAFT_13013 [Coemansia reversa NRRL 1564]|eukprot:PIA19683.1 hypothetical protein COEREDRAFT_13013 [Coemansia reversa NRRL 1564]
MADNFYSPEDQLDKERSRFTYTSTDSRTNVDDKTNSECRKRQRLYYEGETDTTKWTVPPAPEIPSTTTSTYTTSDNLTTVACSTDYEPHTEEMFVLPFMEKNRSNFIPDNYKGKNIGEPELNIDEVVIQQIRSLSKAQNDFERRLYEHRRRIEHEHSKALRQLEARDIIGPIPKKEKDELLQRHKIELDHADRRAVEKLDGMRFQQQLKLQELGVPGIYPSSNVDIMQKQQATLQQLLNKKIK